MRKLCTKPVPELLDIDECYECMKYIMDKFGNERLSWMYIMYIQFLELSLPLLKVRGAS